MARCAWGSRASPAAPRLPPRRAPREARTAPPHALPSSSGEDPALQPPGPEDLLPALDAVAAGEAEAEAVAAVGKEVRLHRHLAREQRLAEEQRVGDRHGRIVLGMEQEARRRVGRDVE